MPLYYVTAVLVVEAPEQDAAAGVAEDLIDAVTRLCPKALNGYALLSEFSESPAPTDWFDYDQKVGKCEGRYTITSEVYS